MKMLTTLTLMLLLGAPAAATSTEWSLVQPGCPVPVGVTPINCGSIGTYLVGAGSHGASCTVEASGNEDDILFPLPESGLAAFPVSAPTLDDLIAARAAAARSGGTPPSFWSAVIDFGDAHGGSTWSMVDTLSQPEGEAATIQIDDPNYGLGNEVGNFHLLAAACRVLDAVDQQSIEAPAVVNFSLGRLVANGDVLTAAGCDADLLTCQTANVLEELHGLGSVLVGAAGNHREALFPAAFDRVIAVGGMGTQAYLDGGVPRGRWETPGGTTSFMPDAGHCVRGWSAPGGSSYSAAMLSGWLSRRVLAGTLPTNPAGRSWTPTFDANLGCHLLDDGTSADPACHAPIDAIFSGLGGGYATDCWGQQVTASLTSPLGVPSSLPQMPSFDEATPSLPSPTPGSDPCLPCGGTSDDDDPDVLIDVSQSPSPAVPTNVELDRVYLQLDATFFLAQLTAGDLASLAAGNLDQLVLAGFAPAFEVSQQASLVYALKPLGSGLDCSVDPGCFWSSSPILKLD